MYKYLFVLILCLSIVSAEINLVNIEIVKNEICKSDFIKFKTLDSNNSFTKIHSISIYQDNIPLNGTLRVDLTKQEYFFQTNNLSEGVSEITIIANQQGKIVNITENFTISDCIIFEDYLELKLNILKTLLFKNKNLVIFFYPIAIMFIVLTYIIMQIKRGRYR